MSEAQPYTCTADERIRNGQRVVIYDQSCETRARLFDVRKGDRHGDGIYMAVTDAVARGFVVLVARIVGPARTGTYRHGGEG